MLLLVLALLAAPTPRDRDVPAKALKALPVQGLQGEVRAFIEPARAGDTLLLSMGAGIPLVTCRLLHHPTEPASLIGHLVESTAVELKVELTNAEVDVRAVAGRLLFTLDLETRGTKGPGELKIGIVSDRALSVVCMHEAVGYRRAFSTMVESVASLRDPAARAPPVRFRKLEIVRVNGHPVGGNSLTVLDSEGGIEELKVRSVILPRPGNHVWAKDVVARQFLRDGIIEAGKYRVGINDTWTEITLRRNHADGRYTVEGKANGNQPVSASFDAPGGLLPETRWPALFRELTAKGGERTVLEYVGEPDAAAPVRSTVRSTAKSRQVQVTGGGQSSTVEVDEHGMWKRDTTQGEAGTFVAETVLTEGQL